MKTTGPEPDSFGRASLSTFAVSLLSMAIGFVSSVAIARALGPAGKGSYNLATTIAGVAATILGLAGASGITVAVARGVASPLPLARILVVLSAVQVPITALALWAISTSPLSSAVLPVDRSALMIAMIAIFVSATSARFFLRCVLIGLQQIVSASWRDLWGQIAAVSVLIAGLGFCALMNYRPSPPLVFSLTLAGALLAFVFMVQALRQIDLPPASSAGFRAVLGYAAPLYAGNVVQFLNYRLDVFLVAAFVGVREVGLYALAVGLGQLLWMVSESVAVALLARVASGSPTDSAIHAARLTRITLMIGVVAAAGLALVASPLVNIVYGQAYADAVPALWALLPGVVAYMAVKVLASYVVGVGRPRILLLVSLVGLCATLSLDVILIPRLGAVGAAIASTVSYSLSAIVMVRWATEVAQLPARAFLLVRREDQIAVWNALRRLVR